MNHDALLKEYEIRASLYVNSTKIAIDGLKFYIQMISFLYALLISLSTLYFSNNLAINYLAFNISIVSMSIIILLISIWFLSLIRERVKYYIEYSGTLHMIRGKLGLYEIKPRIYPKRFYTMYKNLLENGFNEYTSKRLNKSTILKISKIITTTIILTTTLTTTAIILLTH